MDPLAHVRSRTGRIRLAVLAVCVLAVLGFYLRCATSYGKDVGSSSTPAGFQNLQADAFVHGQLALRIPAPAGLMALPDPYDAAQNMPFRAAGLHDLTYFDGRLYTYYGPAPVLLVDVPYRLLTGDFASSTLSCLIYVSLGFLAIGLFFLKFWRRTGDSLFLAFAVAFALLAANQAAPVLLGIPSENQAYIYLLRLFAFLLIIWAILRKNLGRG